MESAVRRLGNRLRLAVARAVVNLVNDATRLQSVQVELQQGVVRDKVEHFQAYGFTSVAHPGSEGIALSVAGSTDHAVVINVADRRFRMTGLQSGEVAMHDDLGHCIYLTRNGIVIDGAGHQILMKNLAKLRVEAGIESTGDIKDRCDGAGKTMASMRTTHNGHTHNETGVVTAGPNSVM